MKKRFLNRRFLESIPKFFRYRVMRKQLRFDHAVEEGIEFKIAESKEELKQAYSLIHRCHSEQSNAVHSESGMLLTKYFALPTTTTLIAVKGSTVVATASLIRQTSLGLPIDEFCGSRSIAGGTRGVIAEISTLAIDKRYNNSRSELFVPLTKFLITIATQVMRVDRLVCSTTSSLAEFYEGVLLFKQLRKRDEVSESETDICFGTSVADLTKRMVETYSHESAPWNAYEYFFMNPWLECFQAPQRKFDQVTNPVFDREMLSYFFKKRSQVVDELAPNDLAALANMYPQDYYREFKSEGISRKELRHATGLNAVKTFGSKESYKVLDASQKGLRLVGTDSKDDILNLRINVGSGLAATVVGRVMWADKMSGEVGVSIIRSDFVWSSFIEHHELSFKALQPA